MYPLGDIHVLPPVPLPERPAHREDAKKEQSELGLPPPVANPDSIKRKWKFKGEHSDDSGRVMTFLKWLGAPYMKLADEHPYVAIALPVAAGLAVASLAIVAALAPPTALLGEVGLGTYLSLLQGNAEQVVANATELFGRVNDLAMQQARSIVRLVVPLAVLCYIASIQDANEITEIAMMIPVAAAAFSFPYLAKAAFTGIAGT